MPKRRRGGSLDWGNFPFFLAVARHGTLSAAARELGVDQATVGRRLARLEASADSRLFDRTPDGYRLTNGGREMLAHVETFEHEVVAMQRQLSGGDTRLEGRVRLAIGEPFSTQFVIPRLDGLRVRHPGIALEVVTGNRTHDLSRREADIALRIAPRPKQPNLVVQRLSDVSIAPYASTSYLARRGLPRKSGDLTGHQVVRYGGELADLPGADWLDKETHGTTTTLTSSSILTVASAIRAGLGIGMLSCYVGDADPTLRRLAPGVVGKSDLYLVFHADLRGNLRVRAVTEYLAEIVERDRDVLDGSRGSLAS